MSSAASTSSHVTDTVTGTSRAAFNPKVVFSLLLFGAAAFFATLYFIGSGNTGEDINDGQAHAAGKGLNGFAALAAMLEAEGYDVSLSRSKGALDDGGLLILTPPSHAEAEEITAVLNDRRYVGPTMVILPKWAAFQLPAIFGGEAKDGWVQIIGSQRPKWTDDLEQEYSLTVESANENPNALITWQGLGMAGRLPDSRHLSASDSALFPLVVGRSGEAFAGYIDDDVYYPLLSEASGIDADNGEHLDQNKWPVMFVIEPDLMNNFGFADRGRAELAVELVSLSMQRNNLPVTFDLTLNGLGQSENLLTLAFTPPFLAATLCLILALIVIAWRAFHRFGPPVAEGRSIAFGKARLVKNSAGFIQRSKRLHLLSGPYTDMMRARLGKALALRHIDDEAIDIALARRINDAPSFTQRAADLRNAKSPHDILRAAAALKSIERMLTK
ncbi:hypothetical protein GCM10023115_08620 [Pontixanthobacter gangjinensis]|uniref:DUF4350 domain-containing protein n=1 Tax=Pontixanthobacter gangjinensis TaxID=1028742 RepID=A0A6I4SKX3_9SPHN|nr:DUF4350 domain-containing protein [Pontixanthobacter gangjinensis]MXO56108.1 DUF4350 domain-containing protein [Pontixanthobacter gangjinensis]